MQFTKVYNFKVIMNALFFTDNSIIVCIWVVSEDESRTKFSVRVKHTATPIDVVAETIRRRSRMMGISKEHADRCIEEYSMSYALKVCGSDEFLLEEYPISQYKVSQIDTSHCIQVNFR